MAIDYQDGRIFHSTLGHAAYSCEGVGFITTFLRGTEWAATGKVTIKVPDDFPTADKSTTRVIPRKDSFRFSTEKHSTVGQQLAQPATITGGLSPSMKKKKRSTFTPTAKQGQNKKQIASLATNRLVISFSN